MTASLSADPNRQAAQEALTFWDRDLGTLQHIRDGGHSVYRFQRDGEPFVLRLTDPRVRSLEDNEAELAFLQHLGACGVQVNLPVASRHGQLVEVVAHGGRTWWASVFSWAPGGLVTRSSPYWNADFFSEWGRSLARIHKAALTFQPKGAQRRWHWADEDLFAHADRYLPVDDTVSRRAYERVRAHVAALPERPDNFGLIHGDYAPANFNFHPDVGITAFDFAHCCQHWFVYDLAISLATLRHAPKAERDQYRNLILAGYRGIMALDDGLLAQLDWLIRLRLLHVYLDRLKRCGPQPTAMQLEQLEQARGAVHEAFEW